MTHGKFRGLFSRPAPYLAWLVLSAVGLLIARATDPYMLGFGAFAAAGISAALGLVALFCGWRAIATALLAAVPTVVAFALLSTYKWN